MLLDSFIFSNFNYCPLVWNFCSASLSQNIHKTQEHALRLLYNDSSSKYNNLLLKAEWPTMKVSRMQKLAIDVFKTLKSLNPDFMHTYFKVRTLQRKKTDLVVYRAKTVTLGEKSLRTFRPKIWNSLPEDVKDFVSLPKFTSFIKPWHGPECNCNICKYSGN